MSFVSLTHLHLFYPAALLPFTRRTPKIDPGILELGLPVFGFCDCAVIISGYSWAAPLDNTEKGEYGPAHLTRAGESCILTAPLSSIVWMSHRDACA